MLATHFEGRTPVLTSIDAVEQASVGGLPGDPVQARRWFFWLLGLGVLLLLLCAYTSYWSGRPWYDEDKYFSENFPGHAEGPQDQGIIDGLLSHRLEGDYAGNVIPFLARHLPAYLPYFLALWIVFRRPLPKKALWVILAVALAARAILCCGDAILETDLYRMLWDGRVLFHGHNPYRYSPQEVINTANNFNRELYSPQQWFELQQLAQLAAQDKDADWEMIVGRISSKETSSTAFPLAQVFFTLCHALQPGSPWLVKGFVILCDLGVIVMVLLLLVRLGFDPHRVVVYAWSPLVLKEFANTGHYDALAILLLLGGLYWVVSNSSARMVKPVLGDRSNATLEEEEVISEDGPAPPRLLFHTTAPIELEVTFTPRSWWASGWLALGSLVSPTAMIALPVVLTRVAWRGVLLFQVALLLGGLLFLPAAGQFLQGVMTQASIVEFNSSLVAFTEQASNQVMTWFDHSHATGLPELSPAPPASHFTFGGILFEVDTFLIAKLLMAGLFLEVLLYFLMHPAHSNVALIRQVYMALGVMVLCSPAASPWTLCWITPFLCLFPNKAWLYLTFSINGYYGFYLYDRYLTWADLGVGGPLAQWESIRWLEYGPFLVMLIWLTVSKWRYYRANALQYLRDHAEPLSRPLTRKKSRLPSFPMGT